EWVGWSPQGRQEVRRAPCGGRRGDSRAHARKGVQRGGGGSAQGACCVQPEPSDEEIEGEARGVRDPRGGDRGEELARVGVEDSGRPTRQSDTRDEETGRGGRQRVPACGASVRPRAYLGRRRALNRRFMRS